MASLIAAIGFPTTALAALIGILAIHPRARHNRNKPTNQGQS